MGGDVEHRRVAGPDAPEPGRRLTASIAVVVLLVFGGAVAGVVFGSRDKHPDRHVHLVPLILALLVLVLVLAAFAVLLVRRRPEIFQPSPLLAIEGSRNQRQVWRAAMKGQPFADEHREIVRATAERTVKVRGVVWIYLGFAGLQLALIPSSGTTGRMFHALLGILFLVAAGLWWQMSKRAQVLATRLAVDPTPKGQTRP